MFILVIRRISIHICEVISINRLLVLLNTRVILYFLNWSIIFVKLSLRVLMLKIFIVSFFYLVQVLFNWSLIFSFA